MEAVDKELHRFEDFGIITRVVHSECPLSSCRNRTGKCAYYAEIVNLQLHVDQHPIPMVEELFAKLQGGQHFSKLDMSDAYLKVELDDATHKLIVLNTHTGLFRNIRLSLGPAPAPVIFPEISRQSGTWYLAFRMWLRTCTT